MLRYLLVFAALLPGLASAAEPRVPWSFKPLARPAVPKVNDSAWPRDDLDRFILARLEAASLKPNPSASRHVLLRRAAFDLTGLPPTPAEIEAFLADKSSDDVAFAKVVDAYLQSPRFGERWGRHWLDVVRYADSVGRSWNAPFLYAWKYRDYVIDAFNADTPYDQFIVEQLAGDLLPAWTVEARRRQLLATGFLAIGPTPIQEGSREQVVLDRVDDQIDVTTRAFLGLTVSCARCHDHKYDPVTMHDYYAIAGIFYSTKTLSGQGARAEGNLEYVDGRATLRLPIGSGTDFRKAPDVPGVHTMSDLRALMQSPNPRFTYDPNRAMGATEGEIRDCAIREQGVPNARGETPARGDIKIHGFPAIPKIPADASGRLELARWIASPEHPLTARVMTNRVWQHLMGRGLVRTPDDFGSTGEEPTHPELLDHLSSRFIADGWSVKRLIRTIMLSRTYRQSGAGQSEAREKDPQNELYWRSNLRRLELEPLRDSMLLAAGRLTFARPEGIQVSGVGGKGRNMATHSLLKVDAPYRTVYLPIMRALVPELFGTFDFPDPCQVMGQREVTTVAPQALFFLNSDFVANNARAAADVIVKESSDEPGRIRTAYLRLLGRPATDEERRESAKFLADTRASASESAAWAMLTQALMASAEFRYVR